MEPAVAQLIIQDQSIAYAITDRSLHIVEVGGASALCTHLGEKAEKKLLYDWVPELVGHEQDMRDLLQGNSLRFELPFVNREDESGQTHYVTLINLPYIKEGSEIAGILHIAEDVTPIANAERTMLQQRNELFLARDELRKQNQKLQDAITEFKQLDALKSQFATVAAHELRNPISTIMLYARMLLDDESEEVAKSYIRNLGVIYRNAERLSRITDNMLDLLKVEIGEMELLIKPLSFTEIISKVEADMRPLLQEKKQRLVARCEANLPPVLCDEDRTIQILSNLIHNASKYSTDGAEINLCVYPDENPDYLHVAIRDTGIGIPEEEHSRLFESFFRASNAHTTNATGSGLGLSIVRALVQLHGGKIWIESKVGQGTTAHVLFMIDN